MANETIVAVFDTPPHADAAVKALKAGGFRDEDISIFDRSRFAGDASMAGKGLREAGLWQRLFGADYKQEATIYGKAIEEGGIVVSLRVLDTKVAHAKGILNLHRPVDMRDRAVTPGATTSGYADTTEKTTAVPLAAVEAGVNMPNAVGKRTDLLRLAEEQLQIGKEMAEIGRTRVRRFTTEREVVQDVTLHEEHAEVQRRAIDEPLALNAIDWSESDIEVVETAEHALISKTAHVVEEIGLRTVGSDHIETVREKLRRQQAEILQLDASGRQLDASGRSLDASGKPLMRPSV